MEKDQKKTSIFTQKYIYIPIAIVIIIIITGISNIHHQQKQETTTPKNQYTNIHQTCKEIQTIRPNTAIPIDPIDISMCTREALAYQYNNHTLGLDTQKNYTQEDIKEYCAKNSEQDDIKTCIDDISNIIPNHKDP